MEDHVRLNRALSTLLDPTRSADSPASLLVARSLADRPRVWQCDAPDGSAVEYVDDDALAKSVRERGSAVSVVVAATLDDASLRALRDRPPALLVLTGPADDDLRRELDRLSSGHKPVALLGPCARLVLRRPALADPLAPVAIAADGDELDRLTAALTREAALALSPTPRWLPSWLADPRLQSRDLIGYAPAEALTPSWLDWLEGLGERASRQLVIPLGVPEAQLEARAPGLEALVVAHALERWTGPIYPAPRVLALLRSAIVDARAEAREAPPAAVALWAQARRALPHVGGRLGMDRPDPALALDVPTAAFLAQRALNRHRASLALLDGDPLGDLDPAEHAHDDDHEAALGVERADAVLDGAGEVLSDHESKVVLRGHGIEVTRQAFATSASGAAQFADKIGYPVALKALSPDLRRKRELGAVELDVPNAAAAKRAYAQIVANVEERAPTAHLDGVVVAEMVPPGLDLRCGALRLANGSMAIFAQVLLDAPVEPVLAPSPLSRRDALLTAEATLATTPSPARRRTTDPDVHVLAGLLVRIDHLVRHTGERLLSVDLSPVRLLQPGDLRRYVTLDARVVQRLHGDPDLAGGLDRGPVLRSRHA